MLAHPMTAEVRRKIWVMPLLSQRTNPHTIVESAFVGDVSNIEKRLLPSGRVESAVQYRPDLVLAYFDLWFPVSLLSTQLHRPGDPRPHPLPIAHRMHEIEDQTVPAVMYPCEQVLERYGIGQPSRAANLDPVVEHQNPNLRTCNTIVPMHGRIEDKLPHRLRLIFWNLLSSEGIYDLFELAYNYRVKGPWWRDALPSFFLAKIAGKM